MMVKCFALVCGHECDIDPDKDIDRGYWKCPNCNGQNSATYGRLRFADRESRNERAKEFNKCQA